MRRFLSTLGLDLQLQWRNKFYAVALFASIISILILKNLFSLEIITLIFPLFYMSGLGGTDYFLLGGMVLFEKNEKTLEAQIVTPLRAYEYLLSKIVSLTFLGILEGLIVGIGIYGLNIHLFYLILGTAAMISLYLLCSLAIVLRYETLNQFFFPSVIAQTLLFIPPALDQLGFWNSSFLYLWPTYGPMILLRASLTRIEFFDLLLSLFSSFCWIVLFFLWTCYVFQKFVIRQEALKWI